MNEIEIKIDYFSATFPLDVDAGESVLFKVHEMVKLISTYLSIKNFEVAKCKYAQNNYNYQFNLGEFIILRLDGPMNDCYQKTCHLEMKGEGCRDFEARNPHKTWANFILFMAELNCRFKRIDIAIDDFTGKDVTIGWITEKVLQKKFYTSVFRNPPIPHGTLETGYSIQFGSNDSPIQLVIYDKKLEQIHRKKKCDKTYWVRFEIRFRNLIADKVALALIQAHENDDEFKLQQFAFEQLYRVLDIKEDNNEDRRHMSRVPTDPKWKAFLQNVEKGVLPKAEDLIPKTFETFLKAAESYISTWLIVKYLDVCKDPYLFEMEIYKFMRDGLKFSKQRFQRLNMYLDQRHLKTLDDAEYAMLHEEFKGIVEDRELPF